MATIDPNARSLTEFRRFIADGKIAARQHYQQLLVSDLSRQQWQGCLQRNVTAVLSRVYDDALAQLRTLSFDTSHDTVDKGLSNLTRAVLATFDGFTDEFLQFAVDKHRSSCALSNFPDEHKPDRSYINDVKREIAGLWSNFALETNHHFLEYRC